MPYWKLFYHFVWATKHREAWLTPDVEPVIHNFLRTKAIGLGATVFALNGWTDHVHMVASVPPKITIAKFIGQVKGVASAKFNKSGLSDIHFSWQDEYAVFSFDAKRLPNYISYVERQKEHHAQATIIPILETFDGKATRMIHEQSTSYLVDDNQWRRELEELTNP